MPGLLKGRFSYAFFSEGPCQKTKSAEQWYSYFVDGGMSFETTKSSFS